MVARIFAMNEAGTQTQPYYVTTPIYYVNDRPHIGHCYTSLVADVAARFMRFLGRDTFFLTGTDEHAEKVVESAENHGVSPIEWADQNAAAFRAAFERLNLSNDDFLRTTEDRHIKNVRACVSAMMETEDIYLGDYVGWWDVSQEEYVTENVAREHDYKSPVTGRELEKRTERNYFFRLSKYEERLIAHIEANPGFIKPEARRNEVIGRIRDGLQDVPVSRKIDPDDPKSQWGIRMPGDETHRIYVWIDALLNYLSAIENEDRQRFWPADVHVVGKDILWFHAVIWPCMLMALGNELPGCVYAHSYWIREGRKMSKSLGNFLDMPTMDAYCERYSRDALRWFLMTQGPMGATDSDFSHAKFVEVSNADLANGVGNALSRVANMIQKYFDGKCPNPHGASKFEGYDWPAITKEAAEKACVKIMQMDLPGALSHAGQILRQVDAFIHTTEPFKRAKDPARMEEVAIILYQSAEAIRIASLLLWPAMPDKMEDLWHRLGCDIKPGRERLGQQLIWGALRPGTPIEKGESLFPRIDPKEEPPVPSVSQSAGA